MSVYVRHVSKSRDEGRFKNIFSKVKLSDEINENN